MIIFKLNLHIWVYFHHKMKAIHCSLEYCTNLFQYIQLHITQYIGLYTNITNIFFLQFIIYCKSIFTISYIMCSFSWSFSKKNSFQRSLASLLVLGASLLKNMTMFGVFTFILWLSYFEGKSFPSLIPSNLS